MSIASLIYSFISNRFNNKSLVQVPNLPRDIFEEIFSYLKNCEVSQLGRSCKNWDKYTRPYLSTLHKQVQLLSIACENHCLVPANQHNAFVNRMFACKLVGDTIIVQMEQCSKEDPDFYINARMRILNTPLSDDACAKQCRNFFLSGQCMEFASINFNNVQSFILRYNLNPIVRRRIYTINKTLNVYLKFRLFKDGD